MDFRIVNADATYHPTEGLDLDTAIHDKSKFNQPLALSDTERWSYHFNLSLVDGQKVSAFVSFARSSDLESTPPSTSDSKVNQPHSKSEISLVHSHVVNFAISVPSNTTRDAIASCQAASTGQYYSTSAMDLNHLARLRRVLETDIHMDPFLHHSLLDMLSKGRVPAPDTFISGDVSISTQGPLSLKYGNLASVVQHINSGGENVYHIVAHAADGSYGFEIDLISRKPPVHFEMNSFSEGGSSTIHNEMSHSFVPACQVSGVVRLGHSQVAVESRNSAGWYEQEPNRGIEEWNRVSMTGTESSWTSASVQFSNGWNLKMHSVWNVDTCDGRDILSAQKAMLISPEAACISCEDYDLQMLESWSSMTTLNNYGTKWKLTVPKLALAVSIEAAFAQQEFGTICAGRGYWKGRVFITGTIGTEQVNGLGFIETRPAQFITSFEKHLKRVAPLTALEVSKFYPDRLIDAEHAVKSLGLSSPNSDPVAGDPLRFMQNVSLDILHRHICAPVRHLVNGSGKSWRSYLLMLSLAALGADPEPFRPLLAGVELVHTGTLIIDDIEDESPIRRGVPAVHTVWGTATAINAGEAAYFAFYTTLQSVPNLSPGKKLGLLDIFFETMRFAHAGQALDIAGQQQSLLDDILAARVDPSTLEQSVLSVHRLKTAIVASNIARISGLLAGASETQTKALAVHSEQMGIAFQIIDDVYDIRRGSHEQNKKESQRMTNQQPLKRRWDDIRCGKISIPIAKAGQMMPLNEAQWVWETVLNKPGDDDITVQKVVDKLECCGAVDACIAEAQEIIDKSWRNLEGCLVDSQAKVYLHALSRYMGEYHAL